MAPMNEYTTEQKSDIVETGVSFLRSIINANGNDAGLELWDRIAGVLGNDIKGEMLFSMLAGNTSNGLTIVDVTNARSMLDVLQALKCYTGLELAEAKDIFIAAKSSPQHILIEGNSRDGLRAELMSLGCKVR